MSFDSHVLEPILESPQMPSLVHELEIRLLEEQRRREEFYKKIQPGDKWEFINGQIIMHSPAKKKHTRSRKRLSYLLETCVSLRDLGEVHDETSLVSLTRNDYLPDILYFVKERAESLSPDTWKYPIPDFIVEVLSDSTEGKDRGIKMKDYAAHGAREYWLFDTDQFMVEQYLLNEEHSRFDLFTKKTLTDSIHCQVIPGFSIPIAAIFDEKIKMQVVRQWLG